MRRSPPCQLALVAALVWGGCGGFKPASTSSAGAAGSHGGAAGAGGGGGGGAGGSVDGSAGGRGGSGGSTPIIFLDGGNEANARDTNCGARSKTAMKVAPDILILLDRSGSMNDNINNQMCRPDGGGMGGADCGAASKWALTVPAITQVVSETDADVRWGLKFFPDNATGTCNVSATAAVDVGPGNAAAIATAIMGATSPSGGVMGFSGTPTRAGTAGATTYLSTLTDTSPKFILLATDGLPTCPAAGTGGGGGGSTADDAAGAVTAIQAAHTAGYPTFVVGIATGGAADTTLSSMATAGGLPRAGTPSYYPVTSGADLAAAIRTLVGVAATCTFQIGPAPTDDGTTDLGRINVIGDGAEIPRDTTHTNGYDYADASMQSIVVHGPLCDQIMSGAIHDVTVTFRCLIP